MKLPTNRWFHHRQRGPADARRFDAGTRSVADLIAPGAVEIARDHVRLDGQFARCLGVVAYPRAVTAGWLSPLVNFEAPLEVSVHVYPLQSAEIVRSLTHKMVQLHSSRLLAERGGRLADPEREVAYEDAERLRDALQRGEERVFAVSLYVLVRAGSLVALDDLTRRVEAVLGGMLAQSRVALLEQEAGLHSCLPEGHDRLHLYRNLDTTSLATSFPFCSATLSMEGGVLYGVATHNQAPVIIDPFDPGLENANLVVFAKSGAGKSYFTKLMAVRNLITGVDFLIIDPEDEYQAICGATDGQYVRLAATSGQRLNPFDLPPAGDEATDALAEQVAALIALLETMVTPRGGSLSPDERACLDRALYATYRRAGVTSDPATHHRTVPTMADLYRTLGEESDETARSLALRLRRYVEGSLRGLFAGPTNVALNRRLVVFNVQALEPELRPVGVHLITAYVWNQVRRQRRPRLLVVDEAWTLMGHPEGAAFLGAMARRARKYYLGLVTITQDVNDFLGADEGRTVLANSALKLLLKQDASSIEAVDRSFRLTGEERAFLLGAGKGEGLLSARGARVALRIEGSPLEHRIATTAPRELAADSPGTPPPGACPASNARLTQYALEEDRDR